MLARVQSHLLQGIDALACEVEVDVDDRALDARAVVGLPDAAVNESLRRVEAALTNAGYPMAQGRVLINLAPADVRKEGPVYDLPIAVGLLIAQGVIEPGQARAGGGGLDPRAVMFAGELALDGRVRPIRGGIAMASLAARLGFEGVVLPADNASEAAVVDGIEAFGVRSLSEVVGLLRGEIEPEPLPAPDVRAMLASSVPAIDFAEVRGQQAVKRAITVAAGGGHNLLMMGPAGSGKTMMAKALPGILPPLDPVEAIEITRIYSAAGLLEPGTGLITTRPVRTPHHTASPAAVVGGGIIPRPGEISLAHHGVLFLDELPEFPRTVLETLRQPLEDHVVTIARARSTLRFPASFMLIAAMNPTSRGSAAPGELGKREMDRYLSRLSGPLLDRIDVHVEAPAVPWSELSGRPSGLSTEAMRAQVEQARGAQRSRQGPGIVNARLSGKMLDEYAPMTDPARSLLGSALTELGLSARAYDKIRRVARTVADLDGASTLDVGHVAEAVGYRLLDRRA